jgi:hypothetical protein
MCHLDLSCFAKTDSHTNLVRPCSIAMLPRRVSTAPAQPFVERASERFQAPLPVRSHTVYIAYLTGRGAWKHTRRHTHTVDHIQGTATTMFGFCAPNTARACKLLCTCVCHATRAALTSAAVGAVVARWGTLLWSAPHHWLLLVVARTCAGIGMV